MAGCCVDPVTDVVAVHDDGGIIIDGRFQLAVVDVFLIIIDGDIDPPPLVPFIVVVVDDDDDDNVLPPPVFIVLFGLGLNCCPLKNKKKQMLNIENS